MTNGERRQSNHRSVRENRRQRQDKPLLGPGLRNKQDKTPRSIYIILINTILKI